MKLNKILVMSTSAALFATVLLAGTQTTHWGYSGHEGPEHWGELESDNVMCKLGHNQSPINIKKSVEIDATNLEKIEFHYDSATTEVLNNGHTIQVNLEAGSSMKIDGKVFVLKQFHFHTPSENIVEGKSFPLEAHMVHVAEDGSLAVIAILFENGNENSLLKKVWEKMPHKSDEKVALAISAQEISEFLPKDKEYYRFEGSLTTPPCSEGVIWLVFKAYDTVSPAQVKEFLNVMHHPNNRPVQDIGARKVIN
jgi:carbonic anhydrase